MRSIETIVIEIKSEEYLIYVYFFFQMLGCQFTDINTVCFFLYKLYLQSVRSNPSIESTAVSVQ